jgi:glycosyltransferase involved in cell wall biosynthesis
MTPSPRRLRVAIFAETYLPYLSGVTVSTEALARGLGAAGHDVLLVAPRPERGQVPGSAGAAGPEPQVAWLPSFQLPRPAPAGYRVPWPVPSAALREAERFRPDVVHAQSPFVSGLMARRIARTTGAALVFTHHTRFGDYGHYLGPLAAPGSALVAAYLRSFWAGCVAVVAPGSELAAEIRHRLAARSRTVVAVIPTGVDVAAIRALQPIDSRVAAGWPADSRVVVSLGRLAPEKSVEVLVGAFATAAAQEAPLRLLLVGGGPSLAWLQKRAGEPDLSGRVLVAGGRPRPEALALTKGGDLFAFASQTETQGLVLAEALAAGLPVVAVQGPGVGDSVRDGIDGIVVAADPAEDRTQRLGDAIRDLAADDDRRRDMAEAAAAGAERFDVRTRIEEVVALYRELLAARR